MVVMIPVISESALGCNLNLLAGPWRLPRIVGQDTQGPGGSFPCNRLQLNANPMRRMRDPIAGPGQVHSEIQFRFGERRAKVSPKDPNTSNADPARLWTVPQGRSHQDAHCAAVLDLAACFLQPAQRTNWSTFTPGTPERETCSLIDVDPGLIDLVDLWGIATKSEGFPLKRGTVVGRRLVSLHLTVCCRLSHIHQCSSLEAQKSRN